MYNLTTEKFYFSVFIFGLYGGTPVIIEVVSFNGMQIIRGKFLTFLPLV